jgi:hypothetical protein
MLTGLPTTHSARELKPPCHLRGQKRPHTYAQSFLTSNGTWPTSLVHAKPHLLFCNCEDTETSSARRTRSTNCYSMPRNKNQRSKYITEHRYRTVT